MDFTIPNDLQELVKKIKKFVEKDLEPISQQVEEEDSIPEYIVKKMRELGLFGLSIPTKFGGLGIGTLGECLVTEEISKANWCFRILIGSNNGLGSMGLYYDGTTAQKEYYLPQLASGNMMSCFALSEPEAGSDAANIQTTAELKNGQWILNGTKHLVTNGDIADIAIVFAVTDKDKRASGGITAFIVEDGSPGFYKSVIERKMGLRGTHTCQFILDNCQVPYENVIGGEEKIGLGFKTAMKTVDTRRLTIGAVTLGAAQKLLELSLVHAKQRVQFGKPIFSFQSIQNMLANMATEIYAARQMLYHAAWLKDNSSKKMIKESAMVKLFCSEMACRVADCAVQIHGAMGFAKDCPTERFYRDLRFTRITEGTSEIQQMIIARELDKDAERYIKRSKE